MQTLISDYRVLGRIVLPYANRQKYMHSFNISDPLMPVGFEDYLEPVISLCRAARIYSGTAYMTVDEKIVEAGMSQRRPGPHVDGCFTPELNDWSHDGSGGWKHYCNNVATKEVHRMPVIVVASTAGCRTWRGQFNAIPSEDGDLSQLIPQLSKISAEILLPNTGYLLSPDCVHESMILKTTTPRTFLRIALPVDFVF